MPDRRGHRGAHPEDGGLFGREWWERLRVAVRDLAWLLSRGYAMHSSLKLVGDRYRLNERQRLAVFRSTCSDEALAGRRGREMRTPGERIVLDGYNVLTTVEAALGGGVLLEGREGCLRDMASMHGHYKRVAETGPALELIGEELAAMGVAEVQMLLDAPVSNSGRLAGIMRELCEERGWRWEVKLVADPDPVLARSAEVVATADSVILDGTRNPEGVPGPRWMNLARWIIERRVPGAWIVPLGRETGD